MIMSVVFGLTLLAFYSEKTHEAQVQLSKQSNYFSFNQAGIIKTIEQKPNLNWDTFNNLITK
ncbi:hypothetical protein STA3757_07950 [Stanieria sp. NIES-3757]|nr:hypothetical protein STA3757_07950 [Stanieria sp. NIES-3757]